MKALTILLSISLYSGLLFAQEAHSPQYKCQLDSDNTIVKYILVGNKFPQIPDLDFSNEVIFVEAQEYASSNYPEEMKFNLIDKDGINFQTDINIIDSEDGLTQTNIIFQDMVLTHTIQHPLSTCAFEDLCTEEERIEEVVYQCIAQGYVDFPEDS
jgi:hypothetical protein